MSEEYNNQSEARKETHNNEYSPTPPTPQNEESDAVCEKKCGGKWKIIAGVIVALVVLGSIISVMGNADVPACTVSSDRQQRTVSIDGACTNGAWGQWEAVSQSTDNTGAIVRIDRRVYTGVRDLASVFDYTVTTNSCTGTSVSGSVVTESTACQIEHTRTLRFPGADPSDPYDPNNPEDGELLDDSVTQADTGDTLTDTESISSSNDILSYRRGLISADIWVNPTIVRSGNTTQVHWVTVEADNCTVTADANADTWNMVASATDGETSEPIREETTYTLSCVDAVDGNPIAPQTAVVKIAPTTCEGGQEGCGEPSLE